jgi:hypothetical protein
MMLIIGVLATLVAAVVISRMWVLGHVNAAALGWMSEQWIAEHRASHS